MHPPPQYRYLFINLPHAHTILGRIVRALSVQRGPVAFEDSALPDLLAELDRLLRPFVEDPPAPVGLRVADEVAKVARQLVAEIERVENRGDRLGQCIRNLFECLGLEEEGAEHSLVCGERPDSPLRP